MDKNVVLGIDCVRELSRKRQLFVFDTRKNVIDEFNFCRYDPEKPKEEPVKENDQNRFIGSVSELIDESSSFYPSSLGGRKREAWLSPSPIVVSIRAGRESRYR